MLLNWGMGGGGIGRPSFALGFANLGSGLVDTSSQGSPVAPTFTRATIAWSKLASGLWAPIASGSARYTFNGATTAVATTGGYFAEGARTELVTPLTSKRDMTDAAWSKGATITVAKTGTGIDGVVNSCSRLTGGAVSATNTAFQTLVAAASSRTYSVWLQRVTGTGVINITQDGGSTFTDVTASVNSSTFTRVELNASVLNAAFGIQVVTNGDVILADFNQFEAATFASSPIDVGGVTRNADVLTYPLTGWYNTATGTVLVNYVNANVATISSVPWEIYTDNNNYLTAYRANAASMMDVFNASVQQVGINIAATQTTGGAEKLAAAWAANDFALVNDGGAVSTDTSGTIPTVTTLSVGLFGSGGGSAWMFGTISSIAYFPSRLPNQALINLTT